MIAITDTKFESRRLIPAVNNWLMTAARTGRRWTIVRRWCTAELLTLWRLWETLLHHSRSLLGPRHRSTSLSRFIDFDDNFFVTSTRLMTSVYRMHAAAILSTSDRRRRLLYSHLLPTVHALIYIHRTVLVTEVLLWRISVCGVVCRHTCEGRQDRLSNYWKHFYLGVIVDYGPRCIVTLCLLPLSFLIVFNHSILYIFPWAMSLLLK